MPGFQSVDVDQADQHFGDRLHDRAGNRRGAVAPAWPADSSRIGMPPSTQASSTPQASSANFIGGTTKQFEFETKGRARKFSSPPAIA